MAGNQTPAATDDLVPFAWAGMSLEIPDTFRLFKVSGTTRKGMIGLADDQRARLELAWGMPRKGRFNADRILRRKLKAAMPPADRRNANKHILSRTLQGFETLLGYRDEDQELDRWFGFIGATKRAVEIVYHHGTRKEDKQFHDHVLTSLIDQPPEKPQQWAFFGHRFATPGGFMYRQSTLNLGDMRVRLTAWKRGLSRAAVTVRLIYPAELALGRMPLDDWLDDHVTPRKRVHRPRYRKRLHRGGIVCTPLDTKLGPALVCETYLRWQFKLISWGLPWRSRCWLIHDKASNTLVLIDAQDKLQHLDTIFDTIVAEMQRT